MTNIIWLSRARYYNGFKSKLRRIFEMKKTTVGLAAMVLVLAMGLSFAFAGDASTPQYNGITVFNMVPAENNAGTLTADSKQPYNGITSFASSPAPANKAGAGTRAEREPYNGVTLFSKS
jgi:hypothetical protein